MVKMFVRSLALSLSSSVSFSAEDVATLSFCACVNARIIYFDTRFPFGDCLITNASEMCAVSHSSNCFVGLCRVCVCVTCNHSASAHDLAELHVESPQSKAVQRPHPTAFCRPVLTCACKHSYVMSRFDSVQLQ